MALKCLFRVTVGELHAWKLGRIVHIRLALVAWQGILEPAPGMRRVRGVT
jgi:hypothetical protein